MMIFVLRSLACCSLTAVFSAPTLALATPQSCLRLVSAQLVSEQTLAAGGSIVTGRFHRSMAIDDFDSAIQLELRRIAAPGKLIRKRLSGWTTYSFWQKNKLCLIQYRARTDRSVEGLASSTQFFVGKRPTNSSPLLSSRVGVPSWWPRLRDLQVNRWHDPGLQVRTIGGYSSMSAANTEQMFINGATRGGFKLTASFVPAAPFDAGPSGSMLLFSRNAAELLVTLMPRGFETGVIAHLKEVSK